MDRRQDPRSIVTPYAFAVHPKLLGVPLATPWQRLGAIAVDGVVIIGLSRIGGLTLAVASSILLFWLAIRGPGQNVIGKLFRLAAGCMGLMVAFITATVFLATEVLDDADLALRHREQASLLAPGVVDFNVTRGAEGERIDISRMIGAFPDIMALQETDDLEEARELMLELAEAARAGGIPLREIRATLEELAPADAPWSGEAQTLVNEAMASLRTTLAEEETSPTSGTDAPSAISDPVAQDSIEHLNALVRDLDEERRDVETELRRARGALAEREEGGLFSRLRDLLDELGLGFGWGALYLTIAHALGKGTSIGKKLFRIRVVMIDLRPLNWWLSFERVGGYAAGLATGLLGFAQVFWDPNRQAIHDKVSETIVIQVGKEAVPGPWMAEGQVSWEKSRSGVPTPPLP